MNISYKLLFTLKRENHTLTQSQMCQLKESSELYELLQIVIFGDVKNSNGNDTELALDQRSTMMHIRSHEFIQQLCVGI